MTLAIWGIVVLMNAIGEVNRFSAWRALGASILAFTVVVVPLIAILVLVVLAMP